jgi:RNA polymerase subunit RPABC4/transcription elongation factor Spt4
MIFIAGVSPKTKILDQNPRRCPVCGLSQAYSKRTDHYLNLFFIPIFRIKKGEPFIICDRCEQTTSGFGQDPIRQQTDAAGTCRDCGKIVDKDFKYCPHCGKRM